MTPMRNKVAIGGLVVVIGIIALGFLARPIPPPKARPSRATGVNIVRSVTLTLTNTNAVTSTQPGTGK